VIKTHNIRLKPDARKGARLSRGVKCKNMNLIREPIDRITINQPPAQFFNEVSKALSDTKFKILKMNNAERLIIIHCIVDLFDMVLWRSWGDKVLLHCMPGGENQTDVRVYGVPNWFRLRRNKNEKVYTKAEIAAELRKIIQCAANQSPAHD